MLIHIYICTRYPVYSMYDSHEEQKIVHKRKTYRHAVALESDAREPAKTYFQEVRSHHRKILHERGRPTAAC